MGCARFKSFGRWGDGSLNAGRTARRHGFKMIVTLADQWERVKTRGRSVRVTTIPIALIRKYAAGFDV